jgi:hypothetical protein
MARNATVTVNPGTWAELSNNETISDVVRIQNSGSNPVFILAGGSTQPTDASGSLKFGPYHTHTATLADMFPGAAGPTRLWAYCPSGYGLVSVSYA